MAEKIVIGEVDLDISKATKDAQALKQSIELLKQEMARAKDEGGETSKEYIELQAALKTTKKEYNSQINIIGKSVQADTAKQGSMEQLRAKLSVVSNQWAALSKDERENTELGQKLTKQKKELTDQLKKEEKATGDTRRNVGNYSEAMSGANDAISQFIPGAGQATGAAKALGGALKVMLGPIGLIIAAFAALISYFKRSEEGQNALMKITKVFQTVLNNFLDIVSKVGETIINAFTKPQETLQKFRARIKSIGQFFQDTFGNLIGGVIEKLVANFLKGFAGIGLAWQKLKNVFTDNTEGINEAQAKIAEYDERILDATERVKKGKENLTKAVVDGYNRARDAVKGFVDEQKEEIKIAQDLADREAELRKLRRETEIQLAKNKDRIQELLLVSKDETLSAEERREAILKANEIQEEELKLKERIAQENLALIKANNALSESTIEDKEKEAQAEAELYNIRAENSAKLRNLKNREIVLDKEILKDQEEKLNETVSILEKEVEAWRQSKEAKALIDEEYYERDFEKQKEVLDRKLEYGLLSEQEYQLALQGLRVEFEEAERERQLEVEAVNFENDMERFQENQFMQLELERQQLENKRATEIAYAERIGADVSKIEDKYTKAAIELKRAELNAKMALAGGFTQNIAQIAGEQTAIGKAASVASATISAIQGAISSYNSLAGIPIVGPVLGAAAAGSALAAGYAQVKQILAVKSGLPGDTGGGGASIPSGGGGYSASGGSASSSSMQSVSASVGQGIVSRDTDNQTSNAISQGFSDALENNPIQPTLVTDDVSVSQSENIERNRTSTL
jgi:hypothetical protein